MVGCLESKLVNFYFVWTDTTQRTQLSITRRLHNRMLLPYLLFSCVLLYVIAKTPTEELLAAVLAKDMGRVEYLLSEGANPDYIDPKGDGWTPLTHAAVRGYAEFVDRLLKAGADPNHREKDGWAPLHFMAAYGNVVVTRVLLEGGANVNVVTNAGLSPMDIARDYEKWEVLQVLEQYHAMPTTRSNKNENHESLTINGRTGLPNNIDPDTMMNAAANGPIEALQSIIRAQPALVHHRNPGDSRTPLHRAASSGSVERAQLLLEAGAGVNDQDANGWTPLMFAASAAHFDLVLFLLSAGSNPFTRNTHGIPAYVLAAENGHPEISTMITSAGLLNALQVSDENKILQMIRAGADPDTTGTAGFTALSYFASRGNIEGVKELVRAGANVNQAEDDKWTPLMFASVRGDIQTVLYLINNGADIHMKNKNGVTAAQLAAAEGHSAVAEILNSYTKTQRSSFRGAL